MTEDDDLNAKLKEPAPEWFRQELEALIKPNAQGMRKGLAGPLWNQAKYKTNYNRDDASDLLDSTLH